MDKLELMFIKIPALVKFKQEEEYKKTFYMVNPISISNFLPYGYEIGGEQKIGTYIQSNSTGILTPLRTKEVYELLKGCGMVFKYDDLDEFK